MRKLLVVSVLVLSAPLLSGCLVAQVAGTAVGLTTSAVTAVGGAVVDLVTEDEQERQAKDIEKLKKENEELRKRQEQQEQAAKAQAPHQ